MDKLFIMKISIFVIAMITMLSISTPAAWLDDWTTATVVTPPSTFKGAERSYYDFGDYSSRWRSSSLSPISIQPARLKAGCGGIDVMLGGMSFGNADQLVKKLQEILQNSPSVALDLAINVLCEQCANSMKWIEDKINALNSIQLDSCKASKALVYSAASMIDPDNQKQELQHPWADYAQSSGLSSAYDEVTKKWSAAGGKVPSAQVADAVSECPYALRSLFQTPSGLEMSTLLDNIADQMSLSREYTQAIRGIIGDIGIAKDESMYQSWLIEPCQENAEILKSGIITSLYLEDSYGICSKSTGMQADLEAWINRMLTQISNKMLAQTQDVSDEEKSFSYNFMNGLHRQILRFGLMSNNGAAYQQINMLTPVIAKHITVKMVGDVVTMTRQLLAQAKEAAAKQNATTNPTSQGKCQVSFFSNTLANMDKFSDRVTQYYTMVRDQENHELQRLASQAELAAKFRAEEDILRDKIAQQFGRVIANDTFKK